MAADSADSPSSSFHMPLDGGEQNHRKRRRNRMRVSCLNCYASKRKCDRKRPCTRCIKHGLTGLCVYELDDPTARDKTQVDETTRLKNRIAELESVIRSLNNRPHPRWLARDGVTHDPSLVALRRGTRRRSKATSKYARSASVEAFFDAIADNGDSEDLKVKVEQEAFTPEFTPSEAGPSLSSVGSPLTPISPLSPDSPLSVAVPYTVPSASSVSPPFSGIVPASPLSTPFSFQDTPYTDPTGFPPSISSFVQGRRDETGMQNCSSQLNGCFSPAKSESSDDGPPLSSLFPGRAEQEITPYVAGFSAQSPIHHPSLDRTSVGIQTSPSPARSPPVSRHCSPEARDVHHCQSGAQNSGTPCRCLTDATVYTPLVHFANALRTSREALDGLHHPLSTCILFRRITELDDHILYVSSPLSHRHAEDDAGICSSASPPTPPISPNPTPEHDFLSSVYLSPTHPPQPTLAPPSSSPGLFDSAVRHPHAHTIPFYSPVPPTAEDHYFDPHTFTITSDILTYPGDTIGYPQLRGWDVSPTHT